MPLIYRSMQKDDDRPKLGKFARKLDIDLRRKGTCQLAFDRLMAYQKRIKFLLREHPTAQDRNGVQSAREPASNL